MPLRPYLQYQPIIGQGTYVDENAVIIGQVTIGEDCSIWPFASLRGDMHHIHIGDRTSVQDGCVLHITHAGDFNPNGAPLTIGSDVTIGHKVMLHGCTIYDACLIGMGSIVLDGAIIETEVILGAGSLVPPGKTLQSGYLWVGSPAIKKRALTQEEKIYIRYSASNYVKLKNTYLQGND
ncbi:gamma carbonic anhydrase family protein [Candidatus Berkiella aquae]|uniref:Gamma carbonic anhydrase family protein n=1 Tax=Candidatus Berkiella aquae TaxID=295108 RepID=A0A0Q9YIG0_9GAMM|nr:gamma carbonic anhydrase family protein [Candidatus Berkiella aquae]MCS5709820.1 gamma carbonic anhydrase family protein [Candidatus Berkiella aquae]